MAAGPAGGWAEWPKAHAVRPDAAAAVRSAVAHPGADRSGAPSRSPPRLEPGGAALVAVGRAEAGPAGAPGAVRDSAWPAVAGPGALDDADPAPAARAAESRACGHVGSGRPRVLRSPFLRWPAHGPADVYGRNRLWSNIMENSKTCRRVGAGSTASIGFEDTGEGFGMRPRPRIAPGYRARRDSEAVSARNPGEQTKLTILVPRGGRSGARHAPAARGPR